MLALNVFWGLITENKRVGKMLLSVCRACRATARKAFLILELCNSTTVSIIINYLYLCPVPVVHEICGHIRILVYNCRVCMLVKTNILVKTEVLSFYLPVCNPVSKHFYCYALP